MENEARRPVGRTVWIAALAVLVALVAAVSASAGAGSAATADAPASQWQTQPVQESQATPTPEPGERPGGREDCPEKDGGGAQSEDQSATPDPGDTAPSPEL